MNRSGLLKRAEKGVIYLGSKLSEELPLTVKLMQAFDVPTMQAR